MLKVRYISTSGLFIKKVYKAYTRLDPHGDNFHQVWSWYVLLAVLLQIRFVTSWPWLLTFWPWTVVIHGSSRDPMPIRSWVHLWMKTSSIEHHWKCVYAATAHEPNHATSKYGSKNWLHFWNARPQYLLIHCTTFIGLRRRLRVV